MTAAVSALLPICLWCTPESSAPPKRPKPQALWENSVGQEFIYMQPGTFQMGEPSSEARDKGDEPPHKITIPKGYWITATKVTVAQFRQFFSETRHATFAEVIGFGWSWHDGKIQTIKDTTWQKPGFAQTDDHPVVFVAWQDAVAFAAWLSQKEHRFYRLPSEAEWEYAARAGVTSTYPWNSETGIAPANCADQASASDPELRKTGFDWNDGFAYTSRVHQFKPNAWGIYDALGNVAEWTRDWYEKAEQRDISLDLPEPQPQVWRAVRGGAFNFGPERCRLGNRGGSLARKVLRSSAFVLCWKNPKIEGIEK
jgi:formylglycine-generating enzyme